MSIPDSRELAAHTRRQAAVAKSMARVRAAELLADFEEQMAREYSWDDRETWSKEMAAVDLVMSKANAEIAEESRRLGIPKAFAPSLSYGWQRRGENSSAERRGELRKVATTRIAALEKAANSQIERRSVEIQTKLLAGRLTTEAAHAFLAEMPTAEQLMPVLDLGAIQRQIHAGEAPPAPDDLL